MEIVKTGHQFINLSRVLLLLGTFVFIDSLIRTHFEIITLEEFDVVWSIAKVPKGCNLIRWLVEAVMLILVE